MLTDGQRLRQFIENQPKSIKSIYTALGLSKQGFYNYFDSVAMEPDTKKKIEKYFKAKIFEAYQETDRAENQERVNIDQNAPVSDFKPQQGHDPAMTIIHNLAEGNRKIAEANASLAKSNEELTSMVKQSVNVQSGILEAFESRLGYVLEFVAEVAAGKRYKSVTEASATLSKLAFDGALDKKGKGTHNG